MTNLIHSRNQKKKFKHAGLDVNIRVQDGTFALIVQRVNAKHYMLGDVNLPWPVMWRQLTTKALHAYALWNEEICKCQKKKFTTFDAQLAVMLVREKLVVMAHYYYS